MKILVTGCAGYIGSHVCDELLRLGHDVVGLDNFSTSRLATIGKINRRYEKKINILIGDVREFVTCLHAVDGCDAVIHIAGLKSVEESEQNPKLYDDVNHLGTKNIVNAMIAKGVNKLIFSSSCAVYGDRQGNVKETLIPNPVSVYGKTKLYAEEYIKSSGLDAISLRYFCPVGSHPDLHIGDDPFVVRNILPAVFKAIRENRLFRIYGTDYDTADGTCVRDYVGITDLTKAHVHMLDRLAGYDVVNIGSGQPMSVLDMIHAVEMAVGVMIKKKNYPRRLGDVGSITADIAKAKQKYGWVPEEDIVSAIDNAWRFTNR